MQKFRSFWLGDCLPLYQRLAMKSFIDFGHEYVLYGYKKFDVPAGVELRDANEMLPESRVFFYGERAGVGRGSVTAFSNLFRYYLLCRMNDWWIDADVVCLSEAVPNAEIFMGWEDEHRIGTAILKFPEESGIVVALRSFAESAGVDIEWGTTGPILLTRLAKERNLLDSATAQSLAYPVHFMDALHILIPARRNELLEKIQGKPFLHMWNEIMRRAVIFPWMAPRPGSLVAELFKRHGIDFGNSPVYSADQIQRLNDNYCAAAF
jgi:hypothetical protein